MHKGIMDLACQTCDLTKEIKDLQDKLRRRNALITDLRGQVKKLNREISALTDFAVNAVEEVRGFDEDRAEEIANELQKI